MPDLTRLAELLQHASALDENLRVATLRVLLAIALRPQGATARRLVEDAGRGQPAVNRAVLRLGSRPSSSHSVGANLGLITTRADPTEPRRHLYALSDQGAIWLKHAKLA